MAGGGPPTVLRMALQEGYTMVVGEENIKTLRLDEEESVLRWAAATGKRYEKAIGAWEI